MNRDIKHADTCSCSAVMAYDKYGKPYRVEWKKVCVPCFELNKEDVR